MRMPLNMADVRDELERIDGAATSYEEFVERFEAPNQPVLITNLTDRWQAKDKWTVEVFAHTVLCA